MTHTLNIDSSNGDRLGYESCCSCCCSNNNFCCRSSICCCETIGVIGSILSAIDVGWVDKKWGANEQTCERMKEEKN